MTGGSSGMPENYVASPLATHHRAVETAAALLVLDVAWDAINFELRRQHGFTESQAAEVIREAAALAPRPTRVKRRAWRRSRSTRPG